MEITDLIAVSDRLGAEFINDAETVRYHLFGVQGIVWTQLTADLFTVAVSYLIYFRIRKQEGWPVTI